MTTRARDFKFDGAPVQRLQLAMLTLIKKSFSAQYAWFSSGGSRMFKNSEIFWKTMIIADGGSRWSAVMHNLHQENT